MLPIIIVFSGSCAHKNSEEGYHQGGGRDFQPRGGGGDNRFFRGGGRGGHPGGGGEFWDRRLSGGFPGSRSSGGGGDFRHGWFHDSSLFALKNNAPGA